MAHAPLIRSLAVDYLGVHKAKQPGLTVTITGPLVDRVLDILADRQTNLHECDQEEPALIEGLNSYEFKSRLIEAFERVLDQDKQREKNLAKLVSSLGSAMLTVETIEPIIQRHGFSLEGKF